MSALSWLGAVGATLFVIVFTVEGWMRPGYRPIYHPVSALSLGRRGWVQVANFVVCGALIGLGAVGAAVTESSVSGMLGSVTIGVAGLALIASGVWSMDPMRGYPPGSTRPHRVGRAHVRHDHAGAVVFSAMPLAPFIWTWAFWQNSETVLASYSALTGIVATVASVWFGSAWEKDHPRTGLIQRTMLTVVCIWITVVYVHVASGGL